MSKLKFSNFSEIFQSGLFLEDRLGMFFNRGLNVNALLYTVDLVYHAWVLFYHIFTNDGSRLYVFGILR